MTEAELDKQTGLVGELTRKVDELQVTADLAARLKDQVDEYVTVICHEAIYLTHFRYRHAADKLQKTENVMEKYKKKLQEGADLRQHVKVSSLVLRVHILSRVTFVDSHSNVRMQISLTRTRPWKKSIVRWQRSSP